jgi:4-hydroxy-tetrahydrodipicolinate synthase
MKHKLTGIIPPLVTPFDKSGRIDEGAMREQVHFMLDKGVHGICVGGSTGEGHTLSLEESRRLVEIATEEVKGKVPVVVGIIANSTYELIERAKAVRPYNPAAIQATPTYYIFNPDDDGNVGHFKALAEAVDTPIIIYNVIRWNILPADLLVRIMKEVPSVIGVKQSAGEIKLLADLLLKAPQGKLIISAQDALLYPTFAIGAHGSIAAIPTAVPTAALALWNATQAGDHEIGLGLHNRLLPLWNSIVGPTCPSMVKYSLSLQGCPVGLPRAPMRAATDKQKAVLEPALRAVLEYVDAIPKAATRAKAPAKV